MQAHEAVWTLSTAVVTSRSLQVVADLGVADHVGDAPVPVSDVAARCGADAGALGRVLRLLAAHGVFRCGAEAVSHTDASRLLRSDHPMSMRAFPRMMGMPSFTASFTALDHAVRTGVPAFELVDAEGLFTYLQRHPDEGRTFGEAMSGKAAADVAAVLDSYDFSGFQTIADIGGGRGHLLRAILDTATGTKGALFDLPAVIDTFDLAQDRLTLAAGDFFVDPLPPADLYLLMEILHDWDDDAATRILAAVGRAATPGAKVLVIENLFSPDRLDPRTHTLDVIMLAITGGRERTVEELDGLFRAAGLEPGPVIETPGALRIAQAVTC